MASETFTFYIQPWYRKSPYFEATKRHGCKSWGLYNHMLLADAVRRPGHRVPRAPERRHAVGRRGRALRRGSGAGRVRPCEPGHLSRSDEGRADAGSVRAPHRSVGRHRERPGPAAAGPRSLLARARRFGCAPVPRGRRGRSRHGRLDLGGRRCPDADPGSRFEGRDARPVRRRGGRPPLLLLRGGRGRRRPGRDQQDRVDGEVGHEVYLQDTSRGDQLFERAFQAGEPYGIP